MRSQPRFCQSFDIGAPSEYSNSMNEELEVLINVTHALHSANIAYMITGSVAMNYYAFPRMTRNIDIVIELKEIDTAAFVNLFKGDFYTDQDSIAEAIRNHGMFNIIHNKYVLKVDFIVKKSSPFRQMEFQRKRQILVEKTPMWIVSPEDLILSKLWWSRDSHSEVQISDIRNLFDSVDDLDIVYIDKWVAEMGLQDIYRMVIDD